MKINVFIIDTSAILSGKTINLGEAEMITSQAISEEFKPGGRDYRNFQFLLEKGLSIRYPSKESLAIIQKTAEETGDKDRLSTGDIETLALALDINKDVNKEAIILTDDYSIQNVATTINIKYQSFSQRGIIKKIKWQYHCPGCKKQLKKSFKICPICGTETRLSKVRGK
jgi:UPF0271 protein